MSASTESTHGRAASMATTNRPGAGNAANTEQWRIIAMNVEGRGNEGRPAFAMSMAKPMDLMLAVLPPVLGPVMVTTRTDLLMLTSMATGTELSNRRT